MEKVKSMITRLVRLIGKYPFTAVFILTLAILELSTGRIFAFALFMGCLVFLVIFKAKSHKFIIFPVLALIIFVTPLTSTLVSLHDSIAGAAGWGEITAPNTGLEVLPKTVQQMLVLIHENQLPDYRLSDRMVNDPEIYQRVIEAAWPVRFSKNSQYIFRYEDETRATKSCKVLDHRKGIYLDDCP